MTASLPNRKPEWLKVQLPKGDNYVQIKHMVKDLGLATVCEEARCPNIGECWAGGTATLMLMGEVCTRGCRFCSVTTGNPNGWLDTQEPEKVLQTVQALKLNYVVLTSVDRDDLPDGGADHFAKTVELLRAKCPKLIIETLIPDFQGQEAPLSRLLESRPHVIAQNIETVERLTRMVRDRRAGYQQTLTLLARVKALYPELYTKSSIMLGLGETDDEILQCMKDLRAHGVDILTLGQYLQPTTKHLPVVSYVTPEAFEHWQQVADDLGFLYCASGPLVRSSYKAAEFFIQGVIEKKQQERTVPSAAFV